MVSPLRAARPKAFLRQEWLGLALLLLIFTLFTWRGMTMFFSGDDMMNMYRAWDMSGWQLARAQVMLWMPVYRPVGDGVYRLFYEGFGFHAAPLYVFCWLLLAANVILAHRLFRLLTTRAEALTALSLVLVHGSYLDLYYSAGTIYDRLWFLFTVLACCLFFRFRAEPTWQRFALLCLLSTMAMGAKEGGITLLPILLCCEALFFMPRVWNSATIARWLREAGPLFLTLTVLSLVFLLGRVNRTPGFQSNPGYLPHFGAGVWLARVGDYFGILTYQYARFTPATAAILLVVMAAAAGAARNRLMLFGYAFFIISISPVALIPLRPGYVLYLPSLGLGLYFAAALTALTAPLARRFPQTGAAIFLLVTAAATVVHARNWPPPWQSTPESRLTTQLRRELPSLPPNSKLLFVSDEFPSAAWDLIFNIRLLYGDKSIIVHRMNGAYGQQPIPGEPLIYDHIFAAASGSYVELDPRDPAESIRLNILRNYSVGAEMEMTRADHIAYAVSGLEGQSGEACRWIAPRATFKFKPVAADELTMKFWVPDFVSSPSGRTLAISLDGREIGTILLNQEGMNEARFPLSSHVFRDEGYTLVDFKISNPYKDAAGFEHGLLLCRAGFASSSETAKR